MKTLETERLILRAWTAADADDLFAYARSDTVGPMAGWKPHESLAESQKILHMFMTEDDTWALELKATGHVVGSLGLHRCSAPEFGAELELGYVLAEAYWGQGLTPEAAKRAVAFAFDELHIQALLVKHFPFNTQSKRVIEKCGFLHVGRTASTWARYDGVRLDEEVYRLTRAAYTEKYK